MRRVNMSVDQPSCIELHVRETVRIDRLQPMPDGYVAEQHGALLAPGVSQLHLEAGLYHFRTLDDAQLRVLAGGVQVASTSAAGKDIWPETTNTDVAAALADKGHGPCGRVPALHVEYATEGGR